MFTVLAVVFVVLAGASHYCVNALSSSYIGSSTDKSHSFNMNMAAFAPFPTSDLPTPGSDEFINDPHHTTTLTQPSTVTPMCCIVTFCEME